MKIAVYYDIPFGGAHVAMEEIIFLLKKNNELTFYKNKNQSINIKIFPRLWQEFESIILQCFKQFIQAKEIDKKKYDVVFVSHDRHFQAPWILRFLKTPTVFLCQEPTRSFFEKFLDIDPNLPLINRLYEKINRSIRKKIEIKNAQYATKIISNSKYSREAILKAYGRFSVPLYMGVNPKQFYHQNLKLKNQVVVVGNHEPQKNLSLAIVSIGKINKNIRPNLIIISPRHRPNQELFNLAKSNGVKIDIKETISTSKVRKVYNESLCLLAVAKLEPFGMSVIESLACGTPVVAINEGGFKETILNDQSGYLVKSDSSDIASAVTKLISDKKLRDKMGKIGIEEVSKKFTWKSLVSNLESCFYEVA